jgi:hypothetical protein
MNIPITYNPNSMLKFLFNNLKKSTDFYKRKQKNIHFKKHSIEVSKQIPKPVEFGGTFFPQEIIDFINLNATHYYDVSFKLGKRNINLYFTCFNNEEDKYIKFYCRLITSWLHLLTTNYNCSCSMNFNFYLYLTPFIKKLPSNQLHVIDSMHVNTGYTFDCSTDNTVVIFRKEEWFKVFIHETFHNFGLDFSNLNSNIYKSELKKLFNVNTDYKLYESYCETWARIIHTAFYTFLLKNHETTEIFINEFKKNIKKEQFFSLLQSIKVLNFLNLNFAVVTKKDKDYIALCNYLYKEKTAIFSYYIITSILLFNYDIFLNWCHENNKNLFNFNRSPHKTIEYVELIGLCLSNKYFKKTVLTMENNIHMFDSQTLKMSILELI